MSVTGYSYPWDFDGDDAAASRAKDLGVDHVALAASYHATRIVTPLHPTRRVVDVPHSACYVPIRPDAWRGQRLQPRTPTWVTDDSFNDAERRLREAGLSVSAWIVLTHDDDLGVDNPDLVVRNAFDEPYPYALCPRSPDVRQYCATLVQETLRTTNAEGAILEACGPMGIDHVSVHDKCEYATLSATARSLLSLCFCQPCQASYRDADIDPTELSRTVRRAIDNDAASMGDALGAELGERVAHVREELTTSLRHELVDAVHQIHPSAPVTIHVSASPWTTGSFSPVGGRESLSGVTSAVARCLDEEVALEELTELDHVMGNSTLLGGFFRFDRGWAGDVDATLQRYIDAGMDELHLYHLGLLTRTSRERARRVVSSFHSVLNQAPDSYQREEFE